MSGNELLFSFADNILNIIEGVKKPINIDVNKIKKEFDFISFEDDIGFYTTILSHLCNYKERPKVLSNIGVIKSLSKHCLRNLIVFLEYIVTLIKSNQFEKLYQDPIVKLDISLIIKYLTDKFASEIVESIEFFPLCTKELEKKYKIKNENKTKYDDEIKIKAEKKLKKFESRKKGKFKEILDFLLEYYTDPKHLSPADCDTIEEIGIKYNQALKKMSMNELENNFFNNKSYQQYIEMYLEQLLSNNGYEKDKYEKENEKELYNNKKNQFKNHIFYPDLLKIDLNDIDNCLYFLYFKRNLYKEEPFYDTNEEFKKLLSKKEINIENEDFTEHLKKIVEEESFIKDLKQILEYPSVKNYFETARIFPEEEEENNYNIKFTADEKLGDDLLKDGYNRLMNFIKNDKNFFKNLFIFKYLPKYTRAFVDPNMRIVINPIYFEFSELLDEEKRNVIFRAYLFIIILHEITHLVKFMKQKTNSYDNIPKTPKKKEAGKMFINYLFNLPMIYYITTKQAEIINKIENWNNIELLSKIFEEQKEWYENYKKDSALATRRPPSNNEDSIRFFLSLLGEEEENDKKSTKNIIDDYYDIN